ncbi:MAG: DUF465 domain-containing protein [Pseudomonadota bacterium]
MSAHRPHDLHEEFPHDAETLHRLKLGNAHFNNLAARYQAVNRAIHRIECEVQPCSDFHAEDLKKKQLTLLDEIAEMLEQADATLVYA